MNRKAILQNMIPNLLPEFLLRPAIQLRLVIPIADHKHVMIKPPQVNRTRLPRDRFLQNRRLVQFTPVPILFLQVPGKVIENTFKYLPKVTISAFLNGDVRFIYTIIKAWKRLFINVITVVFDTYNYDEHSL